MKNLKQLVLPCYKLEMVMSCGGMVLPAREHGRDMQPYLSSFPFVED